MPHTRSLVAALVVLLLTAPPLVASDGGCGPGGVVVADDPDNDGGGMGPASEVRCFRADDDRTRFHVALDLAGAALASGALRDGEQFLLYQVQFTTMYTMPPRGYTLEVTYDVRGLRATLLDVTSAPVPGAEARATFDGSTLRASVLRDAVGSPEAGGTLASVYVTLTYCDFAGFGCAQQDLAPETMDGTYAFRVKPGTDATAPAPPTLTAEDAATDGEVRLAWSGAADPESGVAAYDVHRADAPGVVPSAETLVMRLPGTSTTHVDSGLANGVAVHYVVVAVNGQGLAAASNEASATPTLDVVAPPAPGSLAATAGHEKVTLAWTASAASDVAHYLVRQGGAPVASVAATSWTDAGLANGAERCYTVAAVDLRGNEGPAAGPACGTPAAPTPVPVVGWPQFHRDPALSGAAKGRARLDAAPDPLAFVPLGGVPAGAVWGDLDGDGRGELVVALAARDMTERARVVALTVDKGATPPVKVRWSAPLPRLSLADHSEAVVSMPALVESGDGDAGLEIVVAYEYRLNGQAASVTEPRTALLDGHGAVLAALTSGPIRMRNHPVVANADDDAAPEVALLTTAWSGSGPALRVYEAAGGTLREESVHALPSGATGDSTPAFADLDGDGMPEVLVPLDGGNSLGGVRILGLDGVVHATVPLNVGTKGVAAADLDGDAALEIVATGRSGCCGLHSLAVLDTAGGLDGYRLAAGADGGELWTTPSLGDVDGDGRADIAVAETNEFRDDLTHAGDVRVFSYRDGALHLRGHVPREAPMADLESPGGVTLAAVDNARGLDLVVGGRDGTVRAYALRSEGLVQLWKLSTPGPVDAPILVGDVLPNGVADFVVVDGSGRLAVYASLKATDESASEPASGLLL